MKFGCSISWFMTWSAGGQDEQPCEVNSSTTIGPLGFLVLMVVKRACISCVQKKITPRIAAAKKMFLIIKLNSYLFVKTLHMAGFFACATPYYEDHKEITRDGAEL